MGYVPVLYYDVCSKVILYVDVVLPVNRSECHSGDDVHAHSRPSRFQVNGERELSVLILKERGRGEEG